MTSAGHRSGLIACVYRASERRDKSVELAADDLLLDLDSVSEHRISRGPDERAHLGRPVLLPQSVDARQIQQEVAVQRRTIAIDHHDEKDIRIVRSKQDVVVEHRVPGSRYAIAMSPSPRS